MSTPPINPKPTPTHRCTVLDRMLDEENGCPVLRELFHTFPPHLQEYLAEYLTPNPAELDQPNQKQRTA